MPTGYTAGILDGTIKDFKQFAKGCSRAFMISMRDEPNDAEYKEMKPTDFHLKKIKESEDKLKQFELFTGEEVIYYKKGELIKNREYHEKAKVEGNENDIKLNQFLERAKLYKPPTDAHKSIAEFMVEQLETTIDYDGNSTYHHDELKKVASKIENLNEEEVRSEMKVEATKNIAYHTKEHAKELQRCKDNNKWYSDFMESIED